MAACGPLFDFDLHSKPKAAMISAEFHNKDLSIKVSARRIFSSSCKISKPYNICLSAKLFLLAIYTGWIYYGKWALNIKIQPAIVITHTVQRLSTAIKWKVKLQYSISLLAYFAILIYEPFFTFSLGGRLFFLFERDITQPNCLVQ